MSLFTNPTVFLTLFKTAERTTSRTCFLYISDKKGTFHFHFSYKIHIKRIFLKKKGTKWQSLVNSLKVITPIWHYLLSFEHLEIINTFESSKSISSFEITLWPQYTSFIKDHISFWKSSILQNPHFHLKPPVADIKNGYSSPQPSSCLFDES